MFEDEGETYVVNNIYFHAVLKVNASTSMHY